MPTVYLSNLGIFGLIVSTHTHSKVASLPILFIFKRCAKILSEKEIPYMEKIHMLFFCRLIRSIPSPISYPLGNSYYIQKRKTIERGQEGAAIVGNGGRGEGQ